MKYAQLYLLTTVIFFAIDMLWLGLIAKGFYREKLGYLMAPKVNWTAAFIFYFIYIAGILYFVVVPGLNNGTTATVLLNGALLGFLCYATYDLTNLATVRNWPISVVVVDIAWGIVLTASTAFLSYTFALKLLKW
jgi:uncharacterized membrane protein